MPGEVTKTVASKRKEDYVEQKQAEAVNKVNERAAKLLQEDSADEIEVPKKDSQIQMEEPGSNNNQTLDQQAGAINMDEEASEKEDALNPVQKH